MQQRAGQGETRGRDATIHAAVTDWSAQLVDLSRRNPLLYFRDLATGTLDLAEADAHQRSRLLDGHAVRASRLFPDEDGFRRARKSLAVIRRRIRSLEEERGINAGHVAVGMASWPAPQRTGGVADTRAPVLLRAVTIAVKGQNAADFDLELGELATVNPVLLHALSRLSAVDTSDFPELTDEEPLPQQLDSTVVRLRDRAEAAGVTVDIEDKVIVGAFAYEKLPMVEDLEGSLPPLLASHPLVAAMAGDEQAQQALRSRSKPTEPEWNDIAPEDEHLVLDADPSQHKAIAAALAGHDLIVQGPPGTGKSQTIANLLAEATARGRKVLFVAQKRAAIDAVVNNLRACGLEDMVLDLHDPKTSKKAIAEQLQASMEQAERAPRPDVDELHRRLADRRDQLDRRSRAMREVRRPCGVSIVDLHEHIAQSDPEHDLGVVLPQHCVTQLPWTELGRCADELAAFVELDGLRFWRGESAWSNARTVTDRADLPAIHDRLRGVTGTSIQQARASLQRLLATTGLPQPISIAQWSEALALMSGVADTIATHGPDAFDDELTLRRAAVAPRSWRREHGVPLGFFRARALARSARSRRATPATREVLFAELSTAVEQRERWMAYTGGRAPHAVDGLDDALSRYGRLRDDLAAIGATATVGELDQRPEPDMDEQLRRLREDEDVLHRLPDLNGARARFEDLGLGELIDRLVAVGASPTVAAASLRHAWLTSALRELRADVPEYATFTAAAQERAIAEFREADRGHVDSAAARVRRVLAEQQVQARDRWRDQLSLVRGQVARKRGHMPLRRLVDEAPELLLSIRPCWAMSPLVVSQVLPATRLFDLVVFDEASQIEPADAIPAIARGRSVVVAGDSRQLPPTAFFTTPAEDEDDTDSEDALGAFDSILERLSKDLHPITLSWHYRSRDDRLIAYPNREIYRDTLVTFPGTVRESPLQHVQVTGSTPPGTKGLSPAEADRVVELALDHARRRPHDTLGVITLGVSAAELIERRLRLTLQDQRDVAPFFDEDPTAGRGFFVKSLESVQGDERDAIILSVGGSWTASGRLSHHFGPVNQEGGERRLNVAVTRAKKSMTVVSSFGHQDLDEDKLRGAGMRFLRGYLRFAAEQSAATGAGDVRAGSALEDRIATRLREAGIRVHQQYGASRTRIPLAVEDATRQGELVLAVEVDGADYHRHGRSVRERDRLRPDQLARLGWRHHRVWAPDWHRDPDGQLTELVTALASTDAEEVEEAASTSTGDIEVDLGTTLDDRGPERASARPSGLTPGFEIHEYPHTSLVRLARWIDSDGLLRDRDQMIDLMKDELGFRRRGKNIVAACERAIRDARQPGRR